MRHLPSVLLLLAALAALLLQSFSYPDCLSDDAFISFRYALHLVEGHGLVFNAGEAQPVEGYTNFLWTLILAGAAGAGLELESTARWLGLFFAMAAQVATWFLCRALLPNRPLAWPVPALLLAANTFFVVEAMQGLETTLMAALVTGSVALRVAERHGQKDGAEPWPWSALLAGLAALTRPEGYLVFAVLAAVEAVDLVRQRRRPGVRHLRALGLFALPVAPQLLYRLTTYGQWLPHTFHAKTGGGLDQLIRGLHYVSAGWLRTLPWLALAAAALLLATRRSTSGAPRSGMALPTAVWLAAVAGVALVGGDFKPTFRFLVWSLPLLAVLAACGLSWSAARAASRNRVIATTLTMVILAGAMTWTYAGARSARHFATQRQRDLKVLRQAADWFGTNLPADALIATGPAGAIPYYTRRRTLDMWGINDAAIGRRIMPAMGQGPAGHEKGDGASVLARRPAIILFTEARFTPRPLPENFLAQGYLYVSERELLELPDFHRQYKWRSVPLASTMMNFYQRIDDGEGTP